MSVFLKKSCFSPADAARAEVQAFCCGHERWELEVAEWIKCRATDNSALEDIKNFGTEVWLHWTEQNELVGVSSLGESRWSWPPPKGTKTLINIIPCVGVAKAFQGEPKEVPPAERYAAQILDHLIYEATTKKHRHPLIGLMVDQANKRAIRFYEKAGFIHLVQPHQSRGVVYQRMALDISALVQKA
jgi:GNAT superfamily N-acetyltransferase